MKDSETLEINFPSIEWKTEKRKISELKEHPKNPRSIKTQDMEQLKKSIEKFNYVETVVINDDNTILAGHMRIKAMKSLKRGKEEIEVRVPNRKLEDHEAEEYLIRSNKNTGEWDLDLLANNFEVEDLISYGFDEKFLLGDLEEFGNDSEIIEKEVELPDGEKTLSKMTFIFSNEQEEFIQKCLVKSKSMGEFPKSANENSNGNALARIVEMWSESNAIC